MSRRFARAIGVLTVFLVGCSTGAQDVADATAAPTTAPADAPVATDAVGASTSAPAGMSIAEMLRADGRFTRVVDIAERTAAMGGMYQWSEIFDMPADRLGDNEDGVTLFAPTDEAFDALDPALLAVLDDPDVINPVLYDLLAHHYMVRLYPSSQFEAGPQETFRTSPSGPVVLETDPLTWGGHPVIETDMRAGNGYIHVVDGVVIPDNLMEAAAGEAE